MRLFSCLLPLLFVGVAGAADSVQVFASSPTANEQGLVPAQVLFTRSGSGEALTITYRISGTARSTLHQGSVGELRLADDGAGYLSASVPLVFAGGNRADNAYDDSRDDPSGTAEGLGGYVSSITVTSGGADYTSTPRVTIIGTGTGATATAELSGYVSGVTITAGGSGFTSAPTVTISGGGGSGATGVAVLSGDTVTGVTITNGGQNYTSAPNIGFGGGNGTGATGTASIANRVARVEVTSGGQGYTSAAVVFSDDAGGSGATATANLLGRPVDALASGRSGWGYILPSVGLAGGGGSGAVLRPVFSDGGLFRLAVESGGSGYTSAPTITIDAPVAGVTATATAVIGGGRVIGATITTAGSGYGPSATAPDPATGGETQADIDVLIAGPDFEAPAGEDTDRDGILDLGEDLNGNGNLDVPFIESAVDDLDDSGDLIGTLTFQANEIAVALPLVPRCNGLGGARSLVVSIESSPTGAYIVDQQSSAAVSLADADDRAALTVPIPIAYPTVPSLQPALPLEVQGRGEWRINLGNADRFRSIAVEVGGDAAVAAQAAQDTEYILGSNVKSFADTAADYAIVVPLDPAADPLPAAPRVGDTTVPLSSVGLFGGGELVMFENPSSVLNGIYLVTGVTGGTATTNPTITISPAIREIATSYGITRVRRIGEKVFPPPAGGTLRHTWYTSSADVYYWAFPVLDANSPRARRSILLTLVQNDDYRTLSPTSGTVTLADDAVTVGVRLVSNAAKPGTNGIIDVVLSRSFPQTVSVPFAIVSGSATFGSDFTISGVTSGLGAVQIAAGATTAQIVVQPLPAAGAVAESFTLQLLPSADYLLAPQGTSAVNPSASMTISPVPVTTGAQPVYLAIDSVSVNENAGTATVTVRLSDAAGVPLADTLAAGAAVGFTISGTASAGADYTAPVSNSLAMSAATASATIILPILDDNLAENDETITISLNPGPGYQLSSLATGTVTIVDDEPSITIAAPATNPAEGGAVASFTVTASRAVSVATSVAYAVTGTATAGTDYASLSGTIVIPIGQASATVQVSAAADVETDPAETVVLTLLADPLSPATYKLGATTAATAVIDDAVATAIATVTVVATQATATQAPTPVDGALTISAARGVSTSNAELSIPLTVGGTALPGTAYTALPASVTLPELVTTASAPIGAGFLNVQVVGGAPAVLPAGCVLRIGTGGTAETVIVSSETTVGATTTVVPLQAVLAAAWPSGTSIGVSTAVLAVAPLPSAISANGGTVVVSLPASGANWTAGAAPANSGTVTISSGYPRISVALGTTPAEGASGTFTLTSSQTVASATTIAYAISGTATAGADYTAPSGTVVMAAGASQATVSVAILADGVSDPAETLTLTLLIDPGTTPAYQLAASGIAATHTISETATDTTTGGDPKPAPDADASDSGGSCGAGALSGLLIGVLALAGLRRRRR